MELVQSFDGTTLAVHRLGSGRPLVLLHGLFSSAEMNSICARTGPAASRTIPPPTRAMCWRAIWPR